MPALFILSALIGFLILVCLVKIVAKPLGDVLDDYSKRFLAKDDSKNENDKVATFLLTVVGIVVCAFVFVFFIEFLF